MKDRLVGKVFGKLTVIERGPDDEWSKHRRIRWLCQCVCGKKILVVGRNLKRQKNRNACPECKDPKHAPRKGKTGFGIYDGIQNPVDPEIYDLYTWRKQRERKVFGPIKKKGRDQSET